MCGHSPARIEQDIELCHGVGVEYGKFVETFSYNVLHRLSHRGQFKRKCFSSPISTLLNLHIRSFIGNLLRLPT